jgi:hypothetical protein
LAGGTGSGWVRRAGRKHHGEKNIRNNEKYTAVTPLKITVVLSVGFFWKVFVRSEVFGRFLVGFNLTDGTSCEG